MSDDFYDDDYERDPEIDECDHDDYEVDILTGRAECNRCPHSWYQTTRDIEREIERIAEYDRWVHEEQMRERWWGRASLAVIALWRALIPAPPPTPKP